MISFARFIYFLLFVDFLLFFVLLFIYFFLYLPNLIMCTGKRMNHIQELSTYLFLQILFYLFVFLFVQFFLFLPNLPGRRSQGRILFNGNVHKHPNLLSTKFTLFFHIKCSMAEAHIYTFVQQLKPRWIDYLETYLASYLELHLLNHLETCLANNLESNLVKHLRPYLKNYME